MSRLFRTRVALSMVMASVTLLSGGISGYILPAHSQAQPELRRMSPQFVTEAGCPVEVTAASTELEVDPFGQPIAARHYIDWSNASSQPVVAVKFRIGYVLDDGNVQTMAAAWPMSSGATPQAPGSQVSYKWRGERVDAKTRSVKIRVLQVKFADGSEWASEKVKSATSRPAAPAGFEPLQPDTPGLDQIADRSPGSPVPLTDTAKDYKAYPERTQTGTVPFSAVQGTPAAGYQDSAFGGGAPLTSAPAGAPQFSGATPGAAPSWGGASAPAGGTPQFSGATPGAAPSWGGASAPAGTTPSVMTTAAPGAMSTAAPNATTTAAPASVAPTPTYTPAPKAPTAADITDPLGAIDSLLGNPAKSASPSAPAASTLPPATPSTPAPATATPSPAAPSTPATDSSSAAPPVVAPAASESTPAPAPTTPAPTSDNASGSGSSGAAPPATPGSGDAFGN